jgi:hypothetical protein
MTFFVTEPKVKVRKLKHGDRGFRIQADFTLVDRASIDIDARCPAQVRDTIIWAYNNGYLNAVAHVTEQELTFMGLTQ